MSENQTQPTWDDIRLKMEDDYLNTASYAIESTVNWILRHYTLIEKETENEKEEQS